MTRGSAHNIEWLRFASFYPGKRNEVCYWSYKYDIIATLTQQVDWCRNVVIDRYLLNDIDINIFIASSVRKLEWLIWSYLFQVKRCLNICCRIATCPLYLLSFVFMLQMHSGFWKIDSDRKSMLTSKSRKIFRACEASIAFGFIAVACSMLKNQTF